MSILRELEKACLHRQECRDRFSEIESNWADLVAEYEPLVAGVKTLYSSGLLTQSGADAWDLSTILASDNAATVAAGAVDDRKRKRSTGGQYEPDSARKRR